MEVYQQSAITGYEAKGLSGDALAEKVEALEALEANYRNPKVFPAKA